MWEPADRRGSRRRLWGAAGLAAAIGLIAGLGYAILLDDSGRFGGSPPATRTTPNPDGPVDMAGRAPLTGIPTGDPLDHPAVTIKISNTPDAHPHRGLGDADIVFVEPITGSTTRLAAIFHSKLPDEVGPVRSLRPTDAPLIGPTKGVIGNTMAAVWVMEYVDRVADLDNFGTLRVPRGVYRLDPSRRAPNHVFAHPDRLLELSDRTAPPAPYFSYAATPEQSSALRDGRAARSVTVGYGGSASATWTYRSSAGRWVRAEAWSVHRLENGRRVAADNVIVLHAQRDDSFPKAGPSMIIPDLIDTSGSLELFVGGRVVEGTWRKAGINEPFEFATEDGGPLLLTPGQTWVEIALDDVPVRIR